MKTVFRPPRTPHVGRQFAGAKVVFVPLINALTIVRLVALLLSFAASASAQLVRQANTTLNLPAELPAARGYTTQNALGSLPFANPIDVASPPGVTNRRFVIERGVGIQIGKLDMITKSSSFMALSSLLAAQGRPLRTDRHNGILGLAFHGYVPRNNYARMRDLTSGQVNRVARGGTALPATLSATGAFSNLATLTPYAGIVAYAPNVIFWSDYATKSRWFSIKNLTDTVVFSADGNWTLPTGMVWIKQFDFETTRGNPATRQKLETRFIVKTATDVYGLSYKWRADQTDADLVGEDGLSELIPASSPPQTWRYPSRTECRSCHTPVGGFSLTFNTRQMNRALTFGAQTQNQISALSSAGYFSAPVAGVNSLPAFAAADDATASLEWRVRSYLATNCVQCHQPGGAGIGYWDARATTPTDLASLIAGPLVNDGGDPANRWCIAGDTAHSMILKRLQGDGVRRMPPLATAERDLAAETLITNWITTVLPARQSFAQWQTANFGGPDGADAQPGADPDGDGATNDLEFLLSENPLVINPPYLPSQSATGEVFTLTFHHPANRSVLVETTTDLETWSLWDVPGNALFFPAAAQTRALRGPFDAPSRFFRLRLSEP